MIYPKGRRRIGTFAGEQAFVEKHGDEIWCELADSYGANPGPQDLILLAEDLETLQRYVPHVRVERLKAVLFAIEMDYLQRQSPHCPFRQVDPFGYHMTQIEFVEAEEVGPPVAEEVTHA